MLSFDAHHSTTRIHFQPCNAIVVNGRNQVMQLSSSDCLVMRQTTTEWFNTGVARSVYMFRIQLKCYILYAGKVLMLLKLQYFSTGWSFVFTSCIIRQVIVTGTDRSMTHRLMCSTTNLPVSAYCFCHTPPSLLQGSCIAVHTMDCTGIPIVLLCKKIILRLIVISLIK